MAWEVLGYHIQHCRMTETTRPFAAERGNGQRTTGCALEDEALTAFKLAAGSCDVLHLGEYREDASAHQIEDQSFVTVCWERFGTERKNALRVAKICDLCKLPCRGYLRVKLLKTPNHLNQ